MPSAAQKGGIIVPTSNPAGRYTMLSNSEKLQPTVPDDLFDAAQKVIQRTRQATPYPSLLDAKLGDVNTTPLTDAQMASTYDTPLTTVNRRSAQAFNALARTDQELGNPLAEVAQRANDFMARAAVINRHNRRPPLYSESTIKTFIELGYAEPEHSPIMRAAGHVVAPPTVSTDHDISFIIADISTHLSRSHEPQSAEQILGALSHRKDALSRWPQLDISLFIRRIAGINPNVEGRFNPDQPWGKFIGRQQLVANTIIRILSHDQQPRSTQYLTDEINRLVGYILPDGYNILNAIRNVTSTTQEISWHGLATFGLSEWKTAFSVRNVGRRGRTGDLVFAFLVKHGPADIDDVSQHVQRTTKAKRRTVVDAINNDPEKRFISMDNRRVAANPIPRDHNPEGPALTVIPDAQQQGPVLRESELLWLTNYVQAINDLTPPLPSCVAITGARAAGLAHEGDTLEITVVVAPSDGPSLVPRLTSIAAATSELARYVRPNISILSPQQWAHAQAGEAPEAHHNAWLPPPCSIETRAHRDGHVPT